MVWLPFLAFSHSVGLLIIPIDFPIFQRGSNHQPVVYESFNSKNCSTDPEEGDPFRRLVDVGDGSTKPSFAGGPRMPARDCFWRQGDDITI